MREATDAYQRRLFKDAEQRFGDLVSSRPVDVDLLSNWGAAAFAAGDTVHAVIAWQRAARIDPLANDLQERIALLPSGAREGIANVPMIPVSLLQAAALTLWIAGWISAAVLVMRARRAREHDGWRSVLRGAVWVCIAGAITAGGVARWGRHALDPSALSVVVRPETMHVAPGADADALGGVATGDVVRRLARRGDWLHVQHADGREGWLPAVRLTDMIPPADSVIASPIPPISETIRETHIAPISETSSETIIAPTRETIIVPTRAPAPPPLLRD